MSSKLSLPGTNTPYAVPVRIFKPKAKKKS